MPTPIDFANLVGAMRGDLHTDDLTRRLYATDASAYQETPLAVAIPKSESDIALLIEFANKHSVGLIPRTAGTSLAGQVVGSGIVVDVSRHFTGIVEINSDQRWVRVQPGVIRNELNAMLAEHGLTFGPETSTQNRAMLGGMVGNNSCGSNSIHYGSTRDHLIEVRGFLADGSEVVFRDLTPEEFDVKCEGPDCLETKLYRHIRDRLGDKTVRQGITDEFPKPGIRRRNTGYALDCLMDSSVFDVNSDCPFNFCKLIAGSEGTLIFITEIKLRVVALPPPVSGLQCAHFDSIADALQATLIAVQSDVYACELIDHNILECTTRSIEHSKNRFFLEGSPKAILVTEVRGDSEAEVRSVHQSTETSMRAAGLGYAYPVLFGEDALRVWELRKAGLGLLGNIPGDEKTVPVVEDTAVAIQDLPDYIAEFNKRLEEQFGIQCVHYAHAGSGEIHLRPIINLKTSEGKRIFREVAQVVAGLVKEYRGSLSGEHGDGRLRGEFLKQMIGDSNYNLVVELKRTWDPRGILNPNKIVDTPRMNEQLRYQSDAPERKIETVFDFSAQQGILRAAEMCNGSGDCRKTHLAGGVMCPSYMATRNERDTTRARANTLRQILTDSTDANPFDHPDLHEVMDLCLSCKGCKSECPSTVDIGKMKTEFLQHYQDANGVPIRSRIVAGYARGQAIASKVPWLWNGAFGIPFVRRLLNRAVGFHPNRTIPPASSMTLVKWYQRTQPKPDREQVGVVHLFADEFTNYGDPQIGITLVRLLNSLGYQVLIPPIRESGRSQLSKGLLREARTLARHNVGVLASHVTDDAPLIGVEPSAILTFRDEYVDLVGADMVDDARRHARNCYTFEEWFAGEIDAGRISADDFTTESKQVWVHGHCHQKSLSDVSLTRKCVSLPVNYQAAEIPTGCCGMAGSFGYESEHYDLSMQIGEMVLFPAVRAASPDDLISAAGTSCRHQIKDGTHRAAHHPIEILWAALRV
ncbi:FAD-binding and (Fe-S)-binding domain-containing protein [Neorhodopirellula lusitana]|uniref:FAD-binding and (Fe-S)-binding domain-containing protein n=1 Tax=Neorhodopirellula lusitana TaxID=445327 RepID=UPI00384F0CB1